MAKVYVLALSILHVPDKHGKLHAHHPGDWVAVGKHKAREWIETGQAVLPDLEQEREVIVGELGDCGILVRHGYGEQARPLAEKHKLAIEEGGIRLPFKRTLLWDPALELTSSQASLGFSRIAKDGDYTGWEMAAMLKGNRMLVSQYGSDDDRKQTQEIVGDLRLPVYETGALWVKRTNNTAQIVQLWKNAISDGADEVHAFLRTVYTNPVLLCTLPYRWLEQWITV